VLTLVSVVACGGKNPAETTATKVTTSASTTASAPTGPNELEAEELLADALEALEKTDALRVDTEANITISANGMSTSTEFSSLFLASGLTGKNPVWSESLSSTAAGVDSTQIVNFKDGFYFVDAYGFKAKIKKDEASSEAYEPLGGDAASIIKPITLDYITAVSVKDGKTEIAADTMDEDALKTVFEDFLSEIETSFAENFKTQGYLTTLLVEGGKVSVIVGENGDLLEYHVDMDTQLLIEEEFTLKPEYMTLKISYDFKFSEHGTAKPESIPAESTYASVSINEYPFAMVSEAFFAANKLSDLNLTTQTDITMNMGGISVSLTTNGSFTANNYFSTTPVFKETLYISTGYDKQSATVYFANGYYYIDSNGQKLKLSEAEYKALYGEDKKTDIVILPSNISFENSEIFWDEASKIRTVVFYTDGEDFKKNFGVPIESALTLIMGSTSAVIAYEVYYPEVSLAVTSDGKAESYSFSYYLDIIGVVNGAQVNVQALVEERIDFKNFGEPVTVTPPTGYESYPTLGGNT
jgi:hypothetical protein